jgi:glycosyltransferase involved in cell wall biosynthesis
VVIPLRDAADTLGDQLGALAAQDYGGDWELVIADNGSRDAGVALARSFAERLPSLRIVDASQRRGVNYARNCGARAARGELLLYCDADDVVAPGWLKAMAEALPGADLCGGSFDEDALNDPLLRAWRAPRSADALPVSLRFLPFVVGSNCGMRTSLWRELGGWNETYTYGGDDVEFSWRAQLAGYRLRYAPDALVRTRYRTRLPELARQFFRRGRAAPRLFREFRAAGVPRNPPREVARDWLWLLTRVPTLLSTPERRGRWLRRASYSFGRICGSIEQRVLFL